MPAIGASTTGTSSSSGPIRRAGAAGREVADRSAARGSGAAIRVDIPSILPERRRMSGRERVSADAAARGVAIEFVSRPRAGSLEEAAELLGLTPRDIVKTLVVKRS